jgi:hypothetical protein
VRLAHAVAQYDGGASVWVRVVLRRTRPIYRACAAKLFAQPVRAFVVAFAIGAQGTATSGGHDADNRASLWGPASAATLLSRGAAALR